MALHDIDFFETVGAFYALDSHGALAALRAISPDEWTGLAYDFKK